MSFKKNIQAQSEIISTVLLILLSIAAAGIIIAFAVPFVQNQISGSDCVNVVNSVEISNNVQYTCYDNLAKNMSVQIHMGDNQNKTKGFSITLGSASTKNYQITNTLPAGVYLFGGDSILPSANTERTYVITNITTMPDSVSVYSILTNGKICDASDTYNSIVICGT